MTEAEFLERWRSEEGFYAAWGRFVGRRLSELVHERVAPTKLELFLRIPVVPRVKAQDSMLQKAFYRGKNYDHPYDEIEDKVGLRFVVLLAEDIRTIETAINDASEWIATLARDFEFERDLKPYEFDYQSLHYVVRSRLPTEFEGIVIPADIPCEIQIRTLLQHAYSELTHDTIYKPSVQAAPPVKRSAAKSMALIEATSDYFSSVNKIIQEALANTKQMTIFLSTKFEGLIGPAPSATPLNSLIIDHYAKMAGASFESDFDRWLEAKQYVPNLVKSKGEHSVLYRTPAVLLVYYCVSSSPTMAAHDSPLTDKELEPIYSDLGLALPE
jgi:putative GTP pyrophosphokinase